MSDKKCTVNLVVNAARWFDAGEALLKQQALARRWSASGLQDFALLVVGAKLGFTLENTILAQQRWCRAKAVDSDAEAVTAGFAVVNAPHVGSEDTGAGLALEAVEAAAYAACDVVVMVGHSMNWQPLRLKLESQSIRLFELLIPPEGKVVVSSGEVLDLRETARRDHGVAPGSALLKPSPVVANTAAPSAKNEDTYDESFAANAVRGVVKSLANGYGIVTRKDGRGDVQFLAAHVQPPGFEFVEVGDELRFDVVQVSGGKWLAQRVVRV